jgi:hypothetical protein
LIIKLKNVLHSTTVTTIANGNRSIIVEFFPKGFDYSKVITYRGILLNNNSDDLLLLKNSRAILLCVMILKILPHILSKSDVNDNVVNLFRYRIEDPGDHKVIAPHPSIKIALND